MTTTTKFVPEKIGDAYDKLARETFAKAKTTTGEDMLDTLIAKHESGASLVELSMVLLAYQYGDGDVSAIVKAAKAKKGQPGVASYLAKLKTTMSAPEEGGEGSPERDRILYESYARVHAIAKASGQDAKPRLTEDLNARRTAFETKLGRKLAAEEISFEQG